MNPTKTYSRSTTSYRLVCTEPEPHHPLIYGRSFGSPEEARTFANYPGCGSVVTVTRIIEIEPGSHESAREGLLDAAESLLRRESVELFGIAEHDEWAPDSTV